MSADHIALVRAYDGQPLKRIVVEARPDVLYVANPRYLDDVLQGRCKPIGFRRLDCFAWDEAVFETLARTYATSGHTDLEAWMSFPPFAGSSINRHP